MCHNSRIIGGDPPEPPAQDVGIPQAKTRASQRAGFTLLETILAVSLSAVLLALMGSAINLYARLVADRRADVVNAQVARAILHRMAEDLRATFFSAQQAAPATTTPPTTAPTTPTPTTPAPGGVTPGLYGSEFELQLDVLGRFAKPVKYDTLVAMGLDPQSVNLWSDPKIVTYYVRQSSLSELVGTPLQVFDSTAAERNVLIRRVQSRAQAIFSSAGSDLNAEQQGEQLLSDQVVGLAFEYFDGLEWLTEWDSEVDGGLPVAVRITLLIMDADAVSAGSSVAAIDSAEGDTYQITVSLPMAAAAAP